LVPPGAFAPTLRELEVLTIHPAQFIKSQSGATSQVNPSGGREKPWQSRAARQRKRLAEAKRKKRAEEERSSIGLLTAEVTAVEFTPFVEVPAKRKSDDEVGSQLKKVRKTTETDLSDSDRGERLLNTAPSTTNSTKKTRRSLSDRCLEVNQTSGVKGRNLSSQQITLRKRWEDALAVFRWTHPEDFDTYLTTRQLPFNFELIETLSEKEKWAKTLELSWTTVSSFKFWRALRCEMLSFAGEFLDRDHFQSSFVNALFLIFDTDTW